MLKPDNEGTSVVQASTVLEVRTLLDAGLSVGDATLLRTTPPQLKQLDLF